MANPTPKSRTQAPQPGNRRPPNAFVSNDPPEVVNPIWLLKALGIAISAALICGYVTLCFLFYQGQWQLVLHPSRAAAPSAIAGIAHDTVHFGVDESGAPQLTGWWIPASQAGRYSAYTVLYLPSGDGSLAQSTSTLAALHTLGVNIFAFDYRGYGQSAPTLPNQRRMTEDAASAWKYLIVSRALPPTRLILFGVGVGGALAVELATRDTGAPAMILQSPLPDLLHVVLADPRTTMLPVRALFHDRFEIAARLQALKTPKLFLVTAGPGEPPGDPNASRELFNSASEPKMISTLKQTDENGPIWLEQVTRFLDQYLS